MSTKNDMMANEKIVSKVDELYRALDVPKVNINYTSDTVSAHAF